MFGSLNEAQIINILQSHSIGRIGCSRRRQAHIFPVSYVYDDGVIVGQTNEGAKLNLLRKNKKVCFEVDMIVNIAYWESVLILGVFEELSGKEAENARTVLYNKLFPVSPTVSDEVIAKQRAALLENGQRVKQIMYRIKINEMSGRFEK